MQLHVEETGNRSGQPVLFIHGLSQSGLAWHRFNCIQNLPATSGW